MEQLYSKMGLVIDVYTVGHELDIEKISPLNLFLIFGVNIALNLTISELKTKLKNSNYNKSYDL